MERNEEVNPGQRGDPSDEERHGAETVDKPSAEAEIEPGTNQDSSEAESFSSEPAEEAAGEVEEEGT